MPSKQEIESLIVDRGTSLLTYKRSEGNGPVYLVRSNGGFTISLKSGQYGFSVDETGRGNALITFVGGGIHDAEVVSTVPDKLPEGAIEPIDLVLNLKLKLV